MEDDRANQQVLPLKLWQVEEIRRGLAEAERGEFASEAEVEAMFDELTR